MYHPLPPHPAELCKVTSDIMQRTVQAVLEDKYRRFGGDDRPWPRRWFSKGGYPAPVCTLLPVHVHSMLCGLPDITGLTISAVVGPFIQPRLGHASAPPDIAHEMYQVREELLIYGLQMGGVAVKCTEETDKLQAFLFRLHVHGRGVTSGREFRQYMQMVINDLWDLVPF